MDMVGVGVMLGVRDAEEVIVAVCVAGGLQMKKGTAGAESND